MYAITLKGRTLIPIPVIAEYKIDYIVTSGDKFGKY